MLIRAATLFFIFIGYCNAELLVQQIPKTEISYFVGKDENSKKIAKKINSILSTFAPHELTSAPPETGGNDASKTYYSVEVIRNDSKVVSVLIHSEGCEASCASNNDHYNFDASTGQYIHVSSLFTHAGMAKISSKLIKKWTQQLREDAKGQALDNLVDECVDSMQTNYGKGTPYMGYDFEMGPKGITFVGAYCTKIMSSYTVSMSYQEMVNYLSKYGRSVFSKNATIDQPMHPFNQIFNGSIGGKYPIKMFLFEPYPSAGYLDGYYLYAKYNKPIHIIGFYKNNILKIQEKNDKDDDTGAKIIAKPTKKGFGGYWEDNNKKLKFSVVVGYP